MKPAASHVSHANVEVVTVTAVTAASAAKVTATPPAQAQAMAMAMAMAACSLPKAVQPPSLQSQISLQPRKNVRKQLLIL